MNDHTSQTAAPAQLLKVPDVARIYGVTNKSIYRKVETGEIPAVRLGRSLRFRPETIHRLLDEQDAV